MEAHPIPAGPIQVDDYEYAISTMLGASYADCDSSYEGLAPNASLANNMIAGAFAGIAEHTVMYPVDVLKTRMQIINPSPSAIYSGISNAFQTITRVEGARSLWRGVNSVVLGAGPAHAVYFGYGNRELNTGRNG